MSGPVNVGTSVFAFKYKDGIMFAADTSITYGSMLKIKDGRRMCQIGEETIMACSGEMADYQNLQKDLFNKHEEDLIENDGTTFLHAKEYFNWVSRTQYQKRLKSDPLWVTALIGGVNPKTKEVFLGSSNFHGTRLMEDYLITGLGNAYCQNLFGSRWNAEMSYDEAKVLVEDCMRILFFRDKKSADTIQISTITHQEGVKMGEPYKIEASSNMDFYYTRTNEFFRPMRIRY